MKIFFTYTLAFLMFFLVAFLRLVFIAIPLLALYLLWCLSLTNPVTAVILLVLAPVLLIAMVFMMGRM